MTPPGHLEEGQSLGLCAARIQWQVNDVASDFSLEPHPSILLLKLIYPIGLFFPQVRRKMDPQSSHLKSRGETMFASPVASGRPNTALRPGQDSKISSSIILIFNSSRPLEVFKLQDRLMTLGIKPQDLEHQASIFKVSSFKTSRPPLNGALQILSTCPLGQACQN
ncbi:hypothetical protein B0H19DRAFT_1244643 [Mycena capillaripes]|nr:hypothetical protein B0H19DRAFT_1244643 [Mycena capillaripes]